MALNSDAPGFVLLHYRSNGHDHKMKLHVKATPTSIAVGSEPDFQRRNLSTDTMGNCIVDLTALLQPFFSPESTLKFAEYWDKPTEADDPVYIFTFEIDNTGTNADTTPTDWSQYAFTFRTIGGGVRKIFLMETPYVPNLKTSAPYPTGSIEKALADYITGDTNWITGKDNTYPVASLHALVKTNDVLRKRYQG